LLQVLYWSVLFTYITHLFNCVREGLCASRKNGCVAAALQSTRWSNRAIDSKPPGRALRTRVTFTFVQQITLRIYTYSRTCLCANHVMQQTNTNMLST